ncbi:MAG: MgtC/SapB family protein [Acholeplasmatales bacterium]|nr:MgtC/SapB family protein [Acholeplasmatales bacterium]
MKTLDQVIAEKIGKYTVGDWPIGNLILCVIALLLCVILCGAIGFEREKRGRTAGLRTHLLVGLGSCIIMIISIYGFPTKVDGQTYNRDVARLAAQVITGVGFLGAGAIIHRNDKTRGLTTAATIWIVMAIGLACGSMNFILATGGTIIIIIFLTVLRGVEAKISKNIPMIVLHSELGKPIISNILEVAKICKCEIEDIHSELVNKEKLEMNFRINIDDKACSPLEFVSKLEQIDGIIDVSLLNNHKA